MAYCQARQLSCLDLAPSLLTQASQAPVYFMEDSHPNALGHQVMATTVAEHIDPSISQILQRRGLAHGK
jgi:lysophospholipase L1-like esterase